MKQFLSDPWFEDLALRARSLTETATDLNLTICQTVVGAHEAAWHFVVESGAVELRLGTPDTADISLTVDHETACGIHEGTVSAQRAFLDGRLRIGGDISQLMSSREDLAKIVSLLLVT